jgi:hypothetical protein
MATQQQRDASQRRRGARAETTLEWFGREVANDVRITMRARMLLAVRLLRDRTVKNISIPVTKERGPTGRIRVTERSEPGEYPRADTTRLMKDIFAEVDEGRARFGTTLDYGLALEVSQRLNRRFLMRTFEEMIPVVRNVLLNGRGGRTQFRLDNE